MRDECQPMPFTFGDLVTHYADEERRGVVTGITLRPNGGEQFLVTWADSMDEMPHFAIELRPAERPAATD